MSVWRPGTTERWPMLIGSRVRAYMDWRRLGTAQRSRIKVTRHSLALGYFFRPVDLSDKWAEGWIDELSRKYGILRWQRGKWIKEGRR